MFASAMTEDERKMHLCGGERGPCSKQRCAAIIGAAEDDSYQRNMSKRFHFGLELKETDQPVKFKKELYSTLRREYAIRYLEAIGATPTPKMIRMVQQEKPLKKGMVSAAWKSRGGLDDRLYIAPHFHKPPEQEALMKQVGSRDRGKARTKNGGEGIAGQGDKNTNAPLLASLDPPEKRRRETFGGVCKVGGVPIVTEHAVPPFDPTFEFELLKRKYIYPFKRQQT